MSNFQDAKAAADNLLAWAKILPSEPIGISVRQEEESNSWFVAVILPKGNGENLVEAREWPQEMDGVPVRVSKAPVPTLPMSGTRSRG